MTGRTHDAAALSFLIVAATLYPQPSITLATVLLSLLANQMGGIAPDIDQPTAPIWKNLPAEHFLAPIVDKLLGGHRFLTHSIIGAAILSFLAHLLLVFIHPLMPHADVNVIWMSFNIGLLSHLVMDTFTKEGVPWLLPLPIKFGFPPVKALRITTGHWVESFLVFPGLILLDIVLLVQRYHAIVMFLHAHLQA